MQHKRHRKRGTVTLAPAWERGWGVLVGNKPLVLPPGSTASHEVSPSQIVQDPGDQYLIIVILSPRIMPNPRALRPQNQQIHFQTISTLKISMTRSHYRSDEFASTGHPHHEPNIIPRYPKGLFLREYRHCPVFLTCVYMCHNLSNVERSSTPHLPMAMSDWDHT